ncbi:hypothetical protein [Marilutibacter alkalisoli]|uniref:Uncharacterized protein n=1 Tax=Marilutibacter alkalisoli TaxID=2591633 RepID=A0A514BVM9_9GAMM|nr:hypothetical protein [Lysobacter alkalisoli]QDH71412.1 hypothetical protein FKV23_15915 [Lysobacter alkalisoli]
MHPHAHPVHRAGHAGRHDRNCRPGPGPRCDSRPGSANNSIVDGFSTGISGSGSGSGTGTGTGDGNVTK